MLWRKGKTAGFVATYSSVLFSLTHLKNLAFEISTSFQLGLRKSWEQWARFHPSEDAGLEALKNQKVT